MNVRICKCALFFIWQCVFTLCIYGHVSALFLLFLKICFTLSRSVHIWCVETDHCSGWFLLNFPDGDFAVGPRGSAEHVAIFRRAQSLNAVVVCHQLLLHRVSIRVHHVDLPAGFPLAAHPDLRRAEVWTALCIFYIRTDERERCLTWFLTLIMQTTPAQSLSWILMKGLFRSL